MASNVPNTNQMARRFCDIGILPERMLAPIEGYEKLPIVTLEEAVEPLIDIVPKIERNVYIVKQNCQTPQDSLTIDESASIMLYTYEAVPHEDSLYIKLNAALRSEQRKQLTPWFLYLRLILTALTRLPSESCVVFRGVKENFSTQYPKNKTFIWWGFSSCTSSIDVLESEHFFGRTGDRTLFHIKCTTAKDIKNHSFVPSEKELLLLPARQFEVEACLDSGNGLHIIQLKETKPQFDLLEPVIVPDMTVLAPIDSVVQLKKSSSVESEVVVEKTEQQLLKGQLLTQSQVLGKLYCINLSKYFRIYVSDIWSGSECCFRKDKTLIRNVSI